MPNIDGIEVEVSDLGEMELRLREGGVAIPARVLSEDTLRMLGLLALTGVDEHPALVGFEEPENGVHPRRIQLIAELFTSRSSGRSCCGWPPSTAPRSDSTGAARSAATARSCGNSAAICAT